MSGEHTREDRRLWGQKAGHWDQLMGAGGDRERLYAIHPTLWSMLGDVAGLDVLDAGCGTGYLSALLADRGARVTAVDFAPEMVEMARRNLGERAVDCHVDDCSKLSTLPDRAFDRVVSIYVLQDIADLDGAVRAFHRVLRPGGRAVLIFGHPCFNPPGGVQHHDDGTVSHHWSFSYFEGGRFREVWQGTDHATGEAFDFPSAFHLYHRPLGAYWKSFRSAGFACLDFREPAPEPPYPADADPDEIRALRMCPLTVAFDLSVPQT